MVGEWEGKKWTNVKFGSIGIRTCDRSEVSLLADALLVFAAASVLLALASAPIGWVNTSISLSSEDSIAWYIRCSQTCSPHGPSRARMNYYGAAPQARARTL